jgi:dolichyl-phosphate beta-glucosyltransferase
VAESLSIIVPAYNEAAILAQTLPRLHERFPDAELVVVGDGCSDDTGARIGELGFAVNYIEYQPNRGKGYAIRRGMLAAHGDLAVFTDADLPFGVDGVQQVVDLLGRALDRYDVVIASKLQQQRDVVYRSARWAVRRLVVLLTGLRYPDTQAGLKGFSSEARRTIFGRAVVDRFATDIEMLYLAQRAGLRVGVVPLAVAGELRPSTFNSRQGLLLLADLWKIRLHRYD